MIEKIFVKNLKGLRKKAKLTQSDMAENAGISLRYYQRIEAEESWPPPDTIKSLARALHVSEGALFSEDAHKAPASNRSALIAAIVTALPALNDSQLELILELIDGFSASTALDDIKGSAG